MNSREIDRQVGYRLRERRLALRLSQSALARSVGMAYQQLQKYESGRNALSAFYLYRLACVLGVPVAYFFQEWRPPAMVGGRSQRAAVPWPGSDQITLDVFEAFQGIRDPALRRRVAELARILADSSRSR